MSKTQNTIELCEQYMKLKIFIDGDDSLKEKYTMAVLNHNNNINTNKYYDSGFDLFAPCEYSCPEGIVTKINFQVKCAASIVHHNGKTYPTGFYMYPRSSLSKTRLRLANSVGIIDSGYRGNIIGAFDCNSHGEEYKVLGHDKLVQLCAPNLGPIIVDLVDSIEDLGDNTSRGDGGFGSTGR
jgi:dUTP pyrophosphatase